MESLAEPPEPAPAALKELFATSTPRATTVDGVASHWRTWEPLAAGKDLAPVLLVHGGPGSLAQWMSTVPALRASGRRIYAVDMLGSGASDTPPPNPDGHLPARHIAEGLRQLGVAGRVDVVAFSGGGLVAPLMLETHASDPVIRRLVVVGTPISSSRSTRGPRPKFVNWRAKGITPAARKAAHAHNVASLMIADPARADETAAYIYGWDLERDRFRRDERFLADLARRSRKAMAAHPIRKDAIYGTEDRIAGDVEGVWKALDTFEGVVRRVRMEGAGHWVMQERPDEFNALLLAILDEPAEVPVSADKAKL
ncbi:Alpha/Beta hydrolase protein [Hyaloraphidium curvatum]|nr:Alpha/Beta hydrolase protein [Hyaloraphidium curvatum]